MTGRTARRGVLTAGACVAVAALAAPTSDASTTIVTPKAVSGCGPSNPSVCSSFPFPPGVVTITVRVSSGLRHFSAIVAGENRSSSFHGRGPTRTAHIRLREGLYSAQVTASYGGGRHESDSVSFTVEPAS